MGRAIVVGAASSFAPHDATRNSTAENGGGTRMGWAVANAIPDLSAQAPPLHRPALVWMPRFPSLVAPSASLLSLAVVAAACASHDRVVADTAPVSRVRATVERVREARALLADAAASPAVAQPGGFAVPGARIGARAVDGFDVGSVHVQREGASDAAGRLEDGAVVFEDASRGVDAAMFAVRGGIEDLIVLRDESATFAYRLTVPPGHRVQATEDGAAVVDGTGHAHVRVRAPAAWDADGRTLRATLRSDGDVLRVDVRSSAAYPVVVDPVWSDDGALAMARVGATATRLASGKVLIAGGRGATGACEVYDPLRGTFATVGSLLHPRYGHSATALPNGKVLMAGGFDATGAPGTALSSAELFDPVTGVSTPGLEDASVSGQHVAALLTLTPYEGHVIFASPGGVARFDAVTGALTKGPTPVLFPAEPIGALRSLGARLFVTGLTGTAGTFAAAAAEVDCASLETTSIASLSSTRRGATMTSLGDRVLIAGGTNPNDGMPVLPTQIYDGGPLGPDYGPSLSKPRQHHVAIRLPGGDVALVGGDAAGTVEVYRRTGRVALLAGGIGAPTYAPAGALLPSGDVLVVGGSSKTSSTRPSPTRACSAGISRPFRMGRCWSPVVATRRPSSPTDACSSPGEPGCPAPSGRRTRPSLRRRCSTRAPAPSRRPTPCRRRTTVTPPPWWAPRT
jgi:hypothetical protein